MQRVTQSYHQPSSTTYNVNGKRIYTRFHRKPQIYPTSFQTKKTYKIETTLEQESMNNFISNIYKEKKYRGVLDPAAPNNKNIFIDTDSEHQKSELGQDEPKRNKNRKSTRLLIAKTESQFPETYNSQNVFRRDGLVRGYYVKVNKGNINRLNNNYNINTKNTRMVTTLKQTPSPQLEDKIIYDFNKEPQTQIRQKKINLKLLNQTYNRNTISHGCFKKELDLDEWPSVERTQKNINYQNKDIQIDEKEMKTENSNYTENNQNQYIYQTKAKKASPSMVYKKGNISELKPSYSKSNISDISEDFINQYKKQQLNENNNYIIAGNALEIGSPVEYKNNNELPGSSEEDSDRQGELFFYNDTSIQNYTNKRILKGDMNNNSNIIEKDQGGKVDLYYGIVNKKKDVKIIEKNIKIKKTINISVEEIIKTDISKLQLIIKLQRFFKSYFYLKNICATKIQSVWRGVNTRKIMDLYNDLDEFIYHLSKVQFNHFNNDFCFFIKQLFNIYKANVSNGNYNENDESENNEINNEDDENENENCMNQITLEEIEQKERLGEYSYKFPEGSYFDPEKLSHENEIALFVQASSPYYERKVRKKSRDYERLARDYEELYQQYNELKKNSNVNVVNTNNTRIITRKEKNESESTIGSIRSDYKFHKFNSNSKEHTNKKAYSDARPSSGDNGKNLTFSNDYDADLDNRDDDFFNQEISNDDNDNSGSLIKDKKYSYFSIHSDENSKYFDNENPRDREKEIKEGEIYKVNISKNSGGSKFNNSAKYTGCSSRQGNTKLLGLHRYDKSGKNDYSNSPSIERSNNYMGHHSKTFPRKYNNNDSINNILIIPKHEEDFNIINTNLFLSPKDRDENSHSKNVRSDIAITPNIKLEDKNWNEIIEYIKNEEIEIPTQKKPEKIENKNKKETKETGTEITTEFYLYKNEPISNEQFYLEQKTKEKQPFVLENNVAKVNIIKNKIYRKPRKFLVRKNEQINIEGNKKSKTFDNLEKENNNEINLDNKEYKDKKLIQISKIEKSYITTIEEKEKEINIFKKRLEELMNEMKKPKVYDSKLEINNNINTVNIEGTKPQYNELLINKIISQDTHTEKESVTIITQKKVDKYIKFLIEEKDKKEKEWNNLTINRNKDIELKPEEKIKKEKDKEKNNLVINDINSIELKQDEKVDMATLDVLLRSNNNINSLIEDKVKKEKEWNNLVVNKIKDFEIKEEEKENKLTQEITLSNNLICNENQLYIKGTKLTEISSTKVKLTVREEEVEEIRTQQTKTLKTVYKRPIRIKEAKDKNEETESQKLFKIQNIDNCIQINIDRIYENKNTLSNQDIIEQKQDMDKISQKSFAQLQPEEQNNNRFEVIGTLKSKDEKEKEKDIKPEDVKQKDIQDISKQNEQPEMEEESKEREIKITTKKVYRKNIKNKFKNNSITSENEFNIKGIEKSKPILEQQTQENNRFTVEKTVKEKVKEDEIKSQIKENEKIFNQLQSETQDNNRFTIFNVIKTKDENEDKKTNYRNTK